MRKITFTALMLAAVAVAQAQDIKGFVVTKDKAKEQPETEKTVATDSPSYECIYDFNQNIKGKDGSNITETYNTILQIGASFSKFYDYNAYCSDSVNSIKDATKELRKEYSDKMMDAAYYFAPVIYGNNPSGMITVTDDLITGKYNYTEKLPGGDAALGEDTMTVCGYLCNNATISYGGRNWTLWFTPEIPAAYGPWKFCGLPGLVLYAKDNDGVNEFKAISIRKGTVPLTMKEDARTQKTTRDKFVKNKNKLESNPNPLSVLPIEAVSNMSVVKVASGDKKILINGIQVRKHVNGYVPLELE